MVSWSDPALSSSRCVIGVEAGAGSGFPGATHRQNTARPLQKSQRLNTLPNILPPVVQKLCGLRLDFALGQPVWTLSLCLALTPPHKINCNYRPHPNPTSPIFSSLGFPTLGSIQVIWPHVFNVGTVLQVGAGIIELPVEPGWLQRRCPFPEIHGPWFPRLLDGHRHFGPAPALGILAHLSITDGIWVGVSVGIWVGVSVDQVLL